jgi:hypothetical protein
MNFLIFFPPYCDFFLILQDMFKGVVAINPVTDLTAMFTVTDIPDW